MLNINTAETTAKGDWEFYIVRVVLEIKESLQSSSFKEAECKSKQQSRPSQQYFIETDHVCAYVNGQLVKYNFPNKMTSVPIPKVLVPIRD